MTSSLILLLATFSLVRGAHAAARVGDHLDPAGRLVEEVVQPLCGLRGEPTDEAIYRDVGRRLAILYQDNSRAADEALTQLLWFYVGEANGEDLLHNVTFRGERMLPYLHEHRRSPPAAAKRYRNGVLLPKADHDFDTAIKAIKEGKVWGED